jgi:hypothetical protein
MALTEPKAPLDIAVLKHEFQIYMRGKRGTVAGELYRNFIYWPNGETIELEGSFGLIRTPDVKDTLEILSRTYVALSGSNDICIWGPNGSEKCRYVKLNLNQPEVPRATLTDWILMDDTYLHVAAAGKKKNPRLVYAGIGFQEISGLPWRYCIPVSGPTTEDALKQMASKIHSKGGADGMRKHIHKLAKRKRSA